MNTFQPRLFETGDEEKIVGLLKIVFNDWPHFDLPCSSIDHWKWKILDSPTGKQQAGLVFNYEQLIGCNHSIYYHIKIGENKYLGRQAVDFGVHPDFRGMGASKRIGEVMKVKVLEYNPAITYMYTTNEIIMKGYEKRGVPGFPLSIRQLVRINDVDLHLENIEISHSALKGIVFKGLKAVSSIKSHSPGGLDGLEVAEIHKFEDNVEEFWDKIKEHYTWIIVRSKAHLNWRYCDKRGGDYRVTTVNEKGSLLGYCVLRINRFNENYPIGVLVDLLTVPERTDAIHALLDNAMSYFDDNKINYVGAWLVQNHPLYHVLSNYGFIDSRQNINFFYNLNQEKKTYGDDLEQFQKSDPSKYHLMYGDTDMI